MPTVALFVTCVVDQLAPEVGIGAVRLLEAAGVAVEFPSAQTCCGQPACNAGEPEAATRLARHFLDVFEPHEAVVAPSGSCVAMVHHWYERLLTGRDAECARALAAKTYELTSYLVDEIGAPDLGARIDATVTVRDACHGLRTLGVRDAPRRLLEAAGATIVELEEPETCCGFGGTFSVEHGEIAAPLAGYTASTRLARVAARAGGVRDRRWSAASWPGLRAWTGTRDAPIPARQSFRERWAGRTDGGDRW